MAVDLNSIAEKLKKQREVGVSKDGQLTDKNPKNDGSKENGSGGTTLKPKKFFVSTLAGKLKSFFSR